INKFIDEDDINKWQNSQYPKNVEEQPILKHYENNNDYPFNNGMLIDMLGSQPFENVPDGSYPYYYVYNNNVNIIYITHIPIDNDRGISINVDNSLNSAIFNGKFQTKEYKCGDQINFENNIISYYDDYKIEVPISVNETIVLKSMMDIDKIKQTQEVICSIYDKTFPYSTFPEINEFEKKSPLSILLAHLYYKHNNTNEGSFNDIINECCDIIDNILIPKCKNINNIKFLIEPCDEVNNKAKVQYINCNSVNQTEYDSHVKCSYIPYKHYKGIIAVSVGILRFL
ncbi:hypothetical protein PIROE2DRAFT_1980, partial [Piromyces sp. E2]